MDLITEQTNKFYAQELKKAVLSGWSQCGYSEDWLIANKDRLGYREQDGGVIPLCSSWTEMQYFR